MHNSCGEFQFQPDLTTDCGFACPIMSEKQMYNVVDTLAPSFLIVSSSFLLVYIFSHDEAHFVIMSHVAT